jgi:hypothetical protein
MNLPEPRKNLADDEEWTRRRATNVRLGLVLGGVVLVLFLIAIWKYRPL